MKQTQLQIETITKKTQYMAKQVILEGLYEHFGFIDPTLNTDIHDPYPFFIEKDLPFYVGYFNQLIVCTGGLLELNKTTGQMVRISVLKDFRKMGFAQQMIAALEEQGRLKGYKKIMIETNEAWNAAISLYKKLGYEASHFQDNCIFLHKFI